jgi:hypothetical protein
MPRIVKHAQLTQIEMREQALRYAQEWRWNLIPAELHRVCPRANRSDRHFLQITGAGEWETQSGAYVRSIAFRCPQHGDTWEIRQVATDRHSRYTVPFVLHNGEYLSDLYPDADALTDDTPH